MTLTQANTIFKTKYPEGSILPHSFGSNYSEATMKNKVAVMFSGNRKVYIYSGSYEKVLKNMGFVIPKTEKQQAYEKMFSENDFTFDE